MKIVGLSVPTALIMSGSQIWVPSFPFSKQLRVHSSKKKFFFGGGEDFADRSNGKTHSCVRGFCFLVSFKGRNTIFWKKGSVMHSKMVLGIGIVGQWPRTHAHQLDHLAVLTPYVVVVVEVSVP